MTINYHPQVQAAIDKMKQYGTMNLNEMDIQVVRQYVRAAAIKAHPDEIGHVENRTIDGPHGEIPIRIYKPKNVSSEMLPIIVYYHGGGFVMGDLDSYDAICRSMTNLISCIVVSVEYRLAPEHKFPIPSEDAFAAFTWVYNHAQEFGGDAGKIATAGDSAGGNLAAVVALKVLESEDLTCNYQFLMYPSTGVGFTESYQLYSKNDPILPFESMDWMRRSHRRTDEDLENPFLSPYKYQDVTGVAPALIVTGQYDPMRDDGRLYAQKLEQAGVEVIYREYEGMVHGFITMDGLDVGKQALAEACETIKSVFANTSENLLKS